jgi:hypothetical protein
MARKSLGFVFGVVVAMGVFLAITTWARRRLRLQWHGSCPLPRGQVGKHQFLFGSDQYHRRTTRSECKLQLDTPLRCRAYHNLGFGEHVDGHLFHVY